MIEASWQEEDGDVEMEIENGESNSEPEISLHAIAGLQVPKIMWIWGAIKGHSMIALIDSGSRHSFISSRVAHQIDLQPNSVGKLEVMVWHQARRW